jgi:putative heme-binding domain-containing protein
VLGLIEGWRTRSNPRLAAKADPFALLPGGEGRANSAVQAFLRAAAKQATDAQAPIPDRLSAVSLLGYGDFDFAGPTLGGLLAARQPPDVQIQAARAIERIGDPRGGALLITRENWAGYTPRVREAVLAVLTSKPPLMVVLFDAIEAGVVTAPEVSSVRRTQLLKHGDATVRGRAEVLFRELEGGDRMQVYRTYRETLGGKTDVARGREVFVKSCSACHTHQGVGGKVGPDLTGIRNQPADAILLHILVPNYEVAPNYQTLSVVMQDGRSLSGWLAAESGSSLTLRTAAGTEETVARDGIATLTASGLSLMPDGLEHTMARDDVANLIAFLKSDP